MENMSNPLFNLNMSENQMMNNNMANMQNQMMMNNMANMQMQMMMNNMANTQSPMMMNNMVNMQNPMMMNNNMANIQNQMMMNNMANMQNQMMMNNMTNMQNQMMMNNIMNTQMNFMNSQENMRQKAEELKNDINNNINEIKSRNDGNNFEESDELTIYFRFGGLNEKNTNENEEYRISIQCKKEEKVSTLIERYRQKTGFKGEALFTFNAKDISSKPDSTIEEIGIKNGNCIFVVSKKHVKGAFK